MTIDDHNMTKTRYTRCTMLYARASSCHISGIPPPKKAP